MKFNLYFFSVMTYKPIGYLDTCSKNDVISFFRKGFYAFRVRIRVKVGLRLGLELAEIRFQPNVRIRVKDWVEVRVTRNMFKYVFNQTFIELGLRLGIELAEIRFQSNVRNRVKRNNTIAQDNLS